MNRALLLEVVQFDQKEKANLISQAGLYSGTILLTSFRVQ